MGILRNTIGACALMLPIMLMLTLAYFFSPPQGEVALSTMKGDATIRYHGKHGIPYITGTSNEAVFYALGFVHAADRLYDMQVKRAIASGRLAEVATGSDDA
jgi:penicillin amidase